MKKIILYTAILIGSASCKNSWLELTPQGTTIAEATGDYDKLMNQANYYNAGMYTGGWDDMQIMGDEVAAESDVFSGNLINDRLFQWKDTVYSVNDYTNNFFNSMLTQRYAYNLVVAEVMDSKGGTEQQKKELRAQAMATRAWIHFQLVNLYGKPYVASTAATDPGFPVVTAADISLKTYSRGTLQASYDFITKELTDAIPDLNPVPSSNVRMSKPAAQTFLGKTYMFMGRFTDALPYLQDALNSVKTTGMSSLYDYNKEFGPGGSFLPIDPYNGPKAPQFTFTDVKESIFYRTFVGLNAEQGLVLTDQARALFGANDLRLKLYTNTNLNGVARASGRLRKFTNWSAYRYIRNGLELPELYLLLAECKARVNNLSGAVADVEALRKSRMPAADAAVPSAIAGNQNALIRFIMEERVREFAMDGYRWFDMRRMSVDPVFAGTTFTHTLYNTTNGTSTTYTLQPNRFTLKIPGKIMELNPGMPDNP